MSRARRVLEPPQIRGLLMSAQIRAMTRAPKPTEQQREEHERLWRVLRALEQIAAQDITPEEWLAALPDYMSKTANEHMTRARPWLQRLFEILEKPPC